MIVGVPRESYPGERRVALVPQRLPVSKSGIEVMLEAGAGTEAGYPDAEYTAKGAKIVAAAFRSISAADIIAQVLGYGSNDKTGRRRPPFVAPRSILVGFLRPLGGLNTHSGNRRERE